MSVRYQPDSSSLLINSHSSRLSTTTSTSMAKQNQTEIDQMIQRAQSTNRDLVRRDILQALQNPLSSLLLKVVPYYYNDGTSKDLLCLSGTVACQYRGNRYNIPIEIWFQQDHPHVAPLAYVKPTVDMYVSTSSQDVQPDGTIVLSQLKKWRHPSSDMASLLNAMSEAFSRSPPVYSGGANRPHSNPTSMATPYPSTTPYPLSTTSMPTPMGSTSTSYPYGYPSQATTIPPNVYRDSLQTAVLDKIRDRLNDLTQFGKGQIDSLRKTEQDLNDGQFKIQSFIQNIQQQQTQAQNYLSNLQMKIGQLNEATQKMSLSSTSSSSSTSKDQSIRDDAIVTLAPVYKQLLQCYAEEHAIQDLLFYLSDGLRRESIGLEIYLKHVRDLSRRQYFLRATMQKCRQIAGLTSR